MRTPDWQSDDAVRNVPRLFKPEPVKVEQAELFAGGQT